jgi:translation elongation factor EF-Tu-like GTPase
MTDHTRRLLILARLRLLTTGEGGRRGPIASDYRPDWNIGNRHEGQPELNGGRVFLEDREWLQPGEEAVVRIEPLVSDRWRHVTPGLQMAMHEGSRICGVATVLETITVE